MELIDTARPAPQPNHDAAEGVGRDVSEGRCHASDTNALLCHENTRQRVSVTASFRTSDGSTIADLSSDRPVLLVCLRHLGCTFSRQALADVRDQRRAIEQSGTRVVLAHLEDDTVAVPILARYGLDDLPHVSDPEAHVYESCGLERGGARQLLAPRVFWRGLKAALLERHGAGWSGADVRRMPGAFLIDRGRIVRAFRHATSSDRPDYETLCRRD